MRVLNSTCAYGPYYYSNSIQNGIYILVEFSFCMTLLIVISKLRITKWLTFYFSSGEGDSMFNFDIRLPIL